MLLLLHYTAAASPAKNSSGDPDSSDGATPDTVVGPIVKALFDQLKVANTTDALEKKKTIAQKIEQALEQEFPEEKQEKIGKNYNETAKNSDVSGILPYCHESTVPALRLFSCKWPQGMTNWCRLLSRRC